MVPNFERFNQDLSNVLLSAFQDRRIVFLSVTSMESTGDRQMPVSGSKIAGLVISALLTLFAGQAIAGMQLSRVYEYPYEEVYEAVLETINQGGNGMNLLKSNRKSGYVEYMQNPTASSGAATIGLHVIGNTQTSTEVKFDTENATWMENYSPTYTFFVLRQIGLYLK